MRETNTRMRIRIDVDYPYPSRFRSFLYTALGIKTSGEYLKNSKILARMINESPCEVKTYWFFTPKTIPDKELLALLGNTRHELALHIVNDPYSELRNLENSTGRKIRYYTIHGTARLLTRVAWRRWKSWAPRIPTSFPLQSFHNLPTRGLDTLCFTMPSSRALEMAEDYVRKGYVLHFHPIWLLQRGRLNHRGPFYGVLRRILGVDSELESVSISKKFSFRIARDRKEYKTSIVPTAALLQKLKERGADIFTFLERKWCCKIQNPQKSWVRADDNIALLQLKSYDEWWSNLSKKTRNMIRKSKKTGISTNVAEPDDRLAEGIWKIYNETPIRQDRAFPHYGISLRQVLVDLRSAQDCTYVGAFFQNELAGFIQLVHGENITIISQILSLQKHWDKAVNNALIARAVEVCADRHVECIMYGRMGNHPTLDSFKQSNGFARFQLTRYYIPLTGKGRLAVKLGLYREIKDVLPLGRYPLFILYNWFSRTKTRIYNWFSRTKTRIRLRLGEPRLSKS